MINVMKTINSNECILIIFYQVTFYSKHGDEEKLSQIDSQNMNFSLPDHVLAPTIWVCCKRIDATALKEVRKIF